MAASNGWVVNPFKRCLLEGLKGDGVAEALELAELDPASTLL
jgi:hypothetical protein